MTRSELIARIAQRHQELEPKQVEEIVQKIFAELSRTMLKGGRVELRGFGAFTVKHRPSRQGRNPRTGEVVQIQSKSIPFFKSGKELRQLLNPSGL